MNDDITIAKAQTSGNSRDLQFPKTRDQAEFAQYLCEAHAAGIDVDFSRADRKLWVLAFDHLLGLSRFDVARAVAPRLASTFPRINFFQTMAGLFDRLPAPCDDPGFSGFRDDASKEVQIVPRAGSDVALLGFCGLSHRLGIPIDLIHRWFGTLGAHVIYLRDYSDHNYDQGIKSLSEDMPSTIEALRGIVADLGANRIACLGVSVGSYGALRYALELKAEAALVFAATTNLAPGFGNFRGFDQHHIEPGIDLRPLYEAALHAPRVHLVYGEHHTFDRAQAANFLGLPTATFEIARDWGSHAVFLHSIFHGRFDRLIQWLVDPQRSAGAP